MVVFGTNRQYDIVHSWFRRPEKPRLSPIRRYNEPNPAVNCALCLYAVGLGYDRIARFMFGSPKRKTKIAQWIKRRKPPPRSPLPRIRPPKPVKISRETSEAKFQRMSCRKLKKRLRRTLWAFFKLGLYPKVGSTLVGCSRAAFIAHIQSQLPSGLTMSGYGKDWELDHIHPCSTFNLHDPRQRSKAFHWSNIRPLGKSANRRKSAKVLVQQSWDLK